MPEPIKIEFDEDGLKDLVSGWVLQQMSGDQREAVLASAIKHLITEPTGNYGYKGASPLQAAFNLAVERVMHEVAREMLAEDPHVRASIRELIGQAFTKWLSEYGNDHMREGLVDAIVRGLSKP